MKSREWLHGQNSVYEFINFFIRLTKHISPRPSSWLMNVKIALGFNYMIFNGGKNHINKTKRNDEFPWNTPYFITATQKHAIAFYGNNEKVKRTYAWQTNSIGGRLLVTSKSTHHTKFGDKFDQMYFRLFVVQSAYAKFANNLQEKVLSCSNWRTLDGMMMRRWSWRGKVGKEGAGAWHTLC